MISQRKICRELKWQEIEEVRSNYFVKYTSINKVGINYASLELKLLINIFLLALIVLVHIYK